MKKIILTDFFTSVGAKSFFASLAFLTIKLPFLRRGKSVEELEENLLKFLEDDGLHFKDSASSAEGHGLRGQERILSFYNGRTAIFQALKMIGMQEGDEIIVNGYTCISVINSVVQANGMPIYVDIDKENLSFDLDDLEAKITAKTKAIIVQHTFGKTAPIKKILKLAKEKNILIIEDVAHSLGSELKLSLFALQKTSFSVGETKFRKHGTFGDFAIFSVGRDKVISGVNGGFLLINNEKYFKRTEEIEKSLREVPRILVLRNLLYNVFGYLAYKTYSFFGLGKFIIFVSRKLHLINEILDKKEKRCENKDLYYKLPNSLAELALNDLKNLEEYTKKRKRTAKYYDEDLKFKYFKKAFEKDKDERLNYFRYPIVFENLEEMEKFYVYMRQNGVLCGITWSKNNIVPKGIDLARSRYQGDCEKAETFASKILFLPNHKFMKKKDVKRVVKLINRFGNYLR